MGAQPGTDFHERICNNFTDRNLLVLECGFPQPFLYYTSYGTSKNIQWIQVQRDVYH